jgi:radical SAM protein with 4Fe4S-binding SPASM domain
MGCIGFPSHPVWEVTARCNLNCIHCHVAGRPVGEELTTAEGMRLLDQLADVREFRMMAFTGGEPLVREDIFDLLEYSQGLGFSNTMATNAILIDDGMAERLRDSGVSIAAVSLDGNRETHDSIRSSPGSFDAAVRGIKSLGNAEIPIHVNITAMNLNMRQIEEVTDLSEELGASIILYYQLVPVGRGETIGDSALTKSENEELITLMADIQGRCGAIIEPVAGPQYWSYLLDKRGIRGGPLLGLAEKVFHGCSAGRGFVYIKPDGEVLACPFVDASCGNVREEPFVTIWSKSAVLEDLRNREERLKGRCGECGYRTLCGGCRGRAQAMTGDYMGEDPCCFIEEDEGGADVSPA